MNRIQSLGLLAALLLLILPLAACTQTGEALENDDAKGEAADAKPKDPEARTGEEKELVPVEVATLDRGPIEAVLRFSTNLEAENEVQVFSQASRLVTELLVEEGDRVERGQLLLRLQDEEQRSNLARNEQQLNKALREYERQKRLYAQELISEQAFNDATYEVEQLQLAVADARRELSYTEVRAPIRGTITNRLVNLGDHVTVNQHLFDIVDFDSIVARVFVPEREMSRLRIGQPARLYSDSLGAGPRRGRVLRIAPVVDPKSGTIKTTVAIPGNQGLLPGMYVEVELVTDVHQQALLVPKRAVVYDGDQSYVFRLVEGDGDEPPAVERLRIEPLLEDRDFIEPAPGVLEAGDVVVIAGQAGLKDGTRVRLISGVPAAGDETSEDAA